MSKWRESRRIARLLAGKNLAGMTDQDVRRLTKNLRTRKDRMTTKRYAVVAAIAALAVPVAVVEAGSEQVCPEGQELVGYDAGDLEARQKAPPPGTHFKDSVSGSGPDFTVRSDGDSASGNVPLRIECR